MPLFVLFVDLALADVQAANVSLLAHKRLNPELHNAWPQQIA